MTPERFQQIDDILQRTLARPAAERDVFLDEACAGDTDLRREVESLLAFDEADDFLDRPVELDTDLGRRIGPYQTVTRLGRGGMGSVYLASRDGEFERRVALKLIKRGMDSEEIVRRFLAERQILAELDHPRIARLYDGGTSDEGRPYFVMEYIEGEPVDQWCDARRLNVRRRLELFLEICSGVQAAHQHLVVHCDLKPGNILVDAAGTPKLLDFGIAKILDPGGDREDGLTVPGRRPLSLDHASPEQILGERLTTASDIYSLGVLLYQLLTGHLPSRLRRGTGEPPKPSTAVRKTEKIRHSDGTEDELGPEHVSRARASDSGRLQRALSGDLDAIVLRAIRREPGARYGSVEQLAEDVRRHLAGRPVTARRGTFTYRAAKFVHRNRLALAVAASFLVLVTSFIVILSSQLRSKALMFETLVEILRVEYPATGERDPLRIEEALDRSAAIIRQLRDLDERGLMEELLGRAYRVNGFDAKALQYLESSYETRLENLRENPSPVADSLHNLAYQLMDQGDLDEAERMLRESLAMESDLADTEALERRATGLNVLGLVLQKKKRYAAAEKSFRQALELRLEIYDENHPDVVRSYNNLATSLYYQEEIEEAKEIYFRSLEVRLRWLEPPNESLAKSFNQLGSALAGQSEFAEAASFFRLALATRRGIHDTDHPAVVTVLLNLGRVLYSVGQLDEAEQYLQEALESQRRLDSRDPFFAQIEESLVAVAEARRRRAAAASDGDGG